MQSIFLNSVNLKDLINNWNIYMQLNAYIHSLVNNSVQYK